MNSISIAWFSLIIMSLISVSFYINRKSYRQKRYRNFFALILGAGIGTIILDLTCKYMEQSEYMTLAHDLFEKVQIVCFVGTAFLIAVCFLMLHVSNLFSAILRKKEFLPAVYVAFGLLVALRMIIPSIVSDGLVIVLPCWLIYMLFTRNGVVLDEIFGINRNHLFMEKLEKKIMREEPFALIIVSLSLTYENGREVKVSELPDFFSNIMQPFKKEIDKKRLFAIAEDKVAYIKKMRETELQEVIARIRKHLNRTLEYDGRRANLECRLCIGFYPEDADNKQDLLRKIWYSVLESADTESGEVSYIKGCNSSKQEQIRNLEEQKHLLEAVTEEANLAKKEAEAADKAKSTFLANMSHEIRTPLNTILGMTELILREESDKAIKENAWNVKNAGHSLMALIDNILDISKIELGRMELHFEEYNMKKMLQDIINMTSLRIGEKPVEFVVDIDHTIPKYLLGDELRVRQIFVNLLENAAQYTEEGYIRLSVHCTYNDDNVILFASVEDTGRGIPENLQEKIFEHFGMAEESEHEVAEGIGMGLSICRQSLRLIGGDIDVKSEYGKGSSFTVTLPQKCSSRQETLVTLKKRDAYKVLFFEESPEQDKIAKKVFDSFSIQGDYAATTDEFMAKLSREEYTHLFIKKSAYEGMKDAIMKLKNEKAEVLIIKNYGEIVKESDDVLFLYRPLQCMNLIQALNEELYNMQEEGVYQESFTAPEACVLIVDDNESNLRVTEGLLEPYKVNIIKARSGEECLAILRKRQDIHLVYLDYMMTGIDGIETFRQIRRMSGIYYQKLPVVALTVNLYRDVLKQFMEEGFQGYIAKPIEVKLLEQSLKKNLPQEYIKARMVTEQSKKPCELQIEGVDTEAGLKQCCGIMKRYRDILGAVYEDGCSKIGLIQRYYDEKKYHEYMVEVHGLKGACANVGMQQLSNMAKKQEFAVKEGRIEDLKEYHDSFMLYYRTMMLRLAEALHLKESPELTEFRKKNEDMEFEKRLDYVIEKIQSYEDEEAVHEMKVMIEEYGKDYPVFFLSDAIEKLQKLDYSEAERLIINWRRLQDEEDIICRR